VTDQPEPTQTAEEILALLDAVISSIVQTGRVDLVALRSLPRWQAVRVAQLAYLAGALPRAERDAITREAAVLSHVKPAKPARPARATKLLPEDGPVPRADLADPGMPERYPRGRKGS
jgi:hypothetical protein